MATAAAFTSSPQIATFLSSSSSSTFHFHTRLYSLPTTSSFSPIKTTSTKPIILQTNSKLWIKPVAAAAVEDAAVDATDQFVSTTTDDGVSIFVSALFFIAFIGLSVITLGVIYLAVTDFLTKREKEKFEKEEAAKSGGEKKKKRKFIKDGPKGFGQKKYVKAGPKGFGKKIDQNEDDDDDDS